MGREEGLEVDRGRGEKRRGGGGGGGKRRKKGLFLGSSWGPKKQNLGTRAKMFMNFFFKNWHLGDNPEKAKI